MISSSRPLVRVLLVEDDPDDAKALRASLARFKPVAFHVEEVTSVEAALDLLTKCNFDVMLLDLSLPEGEGLTALLRAKEAAPLIPILVMAREDDEALALDAVTLGAQDYVVKRSEDTLVRMLLNAIERHRVLRELREARRQEYLLATHDSLTGLFNRYALLERLGESLARARRADASVAVVFIDLDRFKTINDRFGHAAGDEVLRIAANRLQQSTRAADTLARLGGDEFTVVLNNPGNQADLSLVARRLVGTISAPFLIEGGEQSISASAGVAVFPDDGEDPDVLMRHADWAMYRAKAGGGNGFHFFARGLNATVAGHLRTRAYLQTAITSDELSMHYQPEVDLETGELVGLEALLRWRDQDGGLAAPASVVREVEQAGLISTLGEWVIERVLRDAEKVRGVPIAVNVSNLQLGDRAFAMMVGRLLREADYSPELLELEISPILSLEEYSRELEQLRHLRRRGVRCALAGLGADAIGMRAIRCLPLDKIKVSRSLTSGIPDSVVDVALLRGVLATAETLGCVVVSEGVERREQLDCLVELGCRVAQGFLLARPMPIEKLELLLHEDEPPWFDLIQARAAPRGGQ